MEATTCSELSLAACDSLTLDHPDVPSPGSSVIALLNALDELTDANEERAKS